MTKTFKRFKQNVHHKAVRDLTEVEYARLLADIKANGIQTPIVVTEDGTVVDGHNRLRAAKDCKIPMASVPFSILGNDADPAEMAVNLNLNRRHFTAEELQALVDKGLEEGKSIRDIASETGASKSAVARKAKTSKATKPKTVKGQKRNSAKRQAANQKRSKKPTALQTAKNAFSKLSGNDRVAFLTWALADQAEVTKPKAA